KLSEVYPEAKITLENYDFNYLETALYTGEADVAIAISTCVRSSDTIEIVYLTEIPRLIIYSKKHKLASEKKKLTPQDFQDEIFFIPPLCDEAFVANLVRSFIEPYGVTPHLRFTTSIESMFVSVVNGLGVAVADTWAMKPRKDNYGSIPLNSKHKVIVAWNKKIDNPVLGLFLKELAAQFPESEL
ncbi:MAG: substrate-binding domain-containing protein, partial [Clostridiales Family XIII bacterium]|nr:substrate-binding domain-containing protein [Clostridiales Family XIII bacterium]